jgi:hypothetical protein
MNKYEIRKEMTALINSIKEHSDNSAAKESIPQIELELMLHKIEKLYQKAIVFKHLHAYPAEVTAVAEKKEVITAPVIIPPVIVSPPVIVESPKVEEKKEPVKIPELIEKPVDLFGGDLPPVVEKPKPEKKVEKKEEKPIVTNIQKPAIADITKAIGINDKFLFANELFATNMQEFNIAMQQLNTAESLEHAMDYFTNLQQLYNWDVESETVKRLLDLVDRRYS